MFQGSFHKLLEVFLMLTLALGFSGALAVPVNKFHKFGDLGMVFIETEQKYNWFEAWNECAARNMSLIAVDTPEKNVLLTDILKNVAVNKSLWLGGHDQAVEGHFVWSSTGKHFDFTNWSSGNPDNYNNKENCALIWNVANFEWNDGWCWGKVGFICEENRFLIAARKD